VPLARLWAIGHAEDVLKAPKQVLDVIVCGRHGQSVDDVERVPDLTTKRRANRTGDLSKDAFDGVESVSIRGVTGAVVERQYLPLLSAQSRSPVRTVARIGAALRLPDGPLGEQVEQRSYSDEGGHHRPHLP